jgi:hypothetical protein
LVGSWLKWVLSLHLGFRGRLLLSVFLGEVVPQDASADRAYYGVMSGVVARDTARDCAFEAACRGSRTGQCKERNSQYDGRQF